MPDFRSFTITDFDSEFYLVTGKVRERLSVSKRATRKMVMERDYGTVDTIWLKS
jgi:hypothetical protein